MGQSLGLLRALGPLRSLALGGCALTKGPGLTPALPPGEVGTPCSLLVRLAFHLLWGAGGPGAEEMASRVQLGPVPALEQRYSPSYPWSSQRAASWGGGMGLSSGPYLLLRPGLNQDPPSASRHTHEDSYFPGPVSLRLQETDATSGSESRRLQGQRSTWREAAFAPQNR